MCNNSSDSKSTLSSDIIPCILANRRNNNSARTFLPMDHYRLQLYQYTVAERLRYPIMNSFSSSWYPFLPRIIQPEEPKPQHSYIGLIAMAILSIPEGKLVLSDIYQHILQNYPYFRTRGPGWRNSIRHNLSLNDCFIKVGRSANGKGHYWAIHPANIEDFRKGDFRRRKAQRKVRQHMGLDVDNESLDSLSPPPISSSSSSSSSNPLMKSTIAGPSCSMIPTVTETETLPPTAITTTTTITYHHHTNLSNPSFNKTHKKRRRQFNMDSLLAPDSSDENLNDDLPQSDLLISDKLHRSSSVSPASPRSPTIVSEHFWPTFPIVNYYQALLQSQIKPDTSLQFDS